MLTHEEWQALWCFTFKKPTPPIFPPSITEAIRWLAKIGGFLGRKSDGVPGAESLMERLRAIDANHTNVSCVSFVNVGNG